MKQTVLRPWTMALCMLALTPLYAQISTGFNFGTATDFVGWDNTMTNDPLMIKHEGDQSIDLYTSNIRRFRLLPNGGYLGLGSFAFIPAPGYALLSPNVNQFYTNGAPGPYSLLHLAAATDNAQQQSYRPWMQTGITMTGNADHSYFGQKASSLDFTDVVLHWSDNPSKFLKDRFRFIFTSSYTGASSGAGSVEGLEGMRLFPVDDNSIHIGLGDFYAANLADPTITEPEERLDIVNGRVRIRALPEAAGEADGTYKVMVVDDTPSPSGERGVVKWVDALDLPPTGGTGGGDCDWVINASANRLTTAWQTVGSNGNCPEADWHVGVGSGGTLPGKLTVVESATKPSTAEHGIHVTMNADDETNNGVTVKVVNKPNTTSSISNGVHVESENAGGTTTGLYARGHLASGRSATGDIIGVEAESTVYGPADEAFGTRSEALIHPGSELTKDAIGVYGLARSFTDSANAARILYGVHGRVIAPSPYSIEQRAVYGESNTCSDCWAGYFNGKVKITGDGFVNGNFMITSDENFKTNVQAIEGALGLLEQLQPASYEFIQMGHPELSFPEGRQIGLIAQQVEEVIPELVRSTRVSAAYDEDGGLLAEPVEYKAVNYIGLIPILIAAVQEQQGQLAEASATETELQDRLAAQEARADELAARLDQLEQALALCCTNPGRSESPLAPEGDLKLDPATERLLRIDPNPFTDRTTIRYTLERGGRTMLLVNSSDGKQLQVLQEAVQQAGEYQQEWHTDHLAPGIYYVTLLLDGEPLVKRAVKVR